MAQTGPDAIARRRGQVAERMLALTRAAAERRLDDPRAAMAEVDELTAEFAGDAQIRALAQSTQVALRLAGDAGLTDAATLRTAVADLRRLAGDNPDAAGTLTMMHRLVDALEMHQNGGTEDAVALFSELIEAGAAMPGNSLLREAAAESAPMLDLMRSLMNGVPHADLAEHAGRTGTVRSRADRPGLSDAERALHLIAAGGAALRMGEEQDLSRIDAAIADLRAAVTLTADGHPEHVFALASLALAVHRRAEVTGQVADLDGAIHHLELAREAARGPSHPHWSFVNDMLAQLRHRRGDHRPSRLAALEGLRGYAWRVLLQPDPASARAVAREAAAEAMQVAARCLA